MKDLNRARSIDMEAHIKRHQFEAYASHHTTGSPVQLKTRWQVIDNRGRILESFPKKADAQRALRFLPAHLK